MFKILKLVIHPLKSIHEKREQKAYKLLDFMFDTAKSNGIVKTKEEFADKYLRKVFE